jgi:hypothetical protein
VAWSVLKLLSMDSEWHAAAGSARWAQGEGTLLRPMAFFVFVLALVGVACGGNGGGGMMAGPSAAAVFMSVSPSGNAVDVSISTGIFVRFSQRMGAGTEQFIDLHEGDTSGPIVPMTCAWSGDRATVTCQPRQPLEHQTRYTTHLGGGMMDADDHPVNMDPGLQVGGQWLMPNMMGGRHDGMPMGMMGSGWHGLNGSYGMFFPFTTN